MTGDGFLEEYLLINNETKEMQEMFLLGKEYGYICGFINNNHEFDGPIHTKKMDVAYSLLGKRWC